MRFKEMPERGRQTWLRMVTGVKQPTAHGWYHGLFKPDEENTKVLARELGVEYDWLRFGSGPERQQMFDKLFAHEEPDHVIVRFWHQGGASAGHGALNLTGNEAIGGLAFKRYSLNRKNLFARNCEVFPVRGDSMLPRIKNGDTVLFDTSDTRIRDGKIYVITLGQGEYAETFVKRLFREPDGSVRIVSDNKTNPEYQDRIVREDEPGFAVLGRVRWVGSWED